MELIVHIHTGEILNKKVVKNAFANLKDGAHMVKITNKNKRSNNQNAYYHGVVLPIILQGLKEVGYNEVKTVNDAHEVLKYLFLKKQIPNVNTGEVITTLGSTARLTTIEFMEFIEQIQQWAAEYLNVQILAPNEQLQIFN